MNLAIQFAAALLLAPHAAAPRDEVFAPAAEMRAAIEDLAARVPPAEQAATRYLSLYALDRAAWPRAAAAVSLVINSVSRADVIARPVVVPGGDGRLLRISFDTYGLPRETWDKLAAGDPYQVAWTLPSLGAEPTAHAGGAQVAIAGLVIRADYFIARAATTLDGGLYYELAGVPPREADFFRLLGLDLKTIGQLRADEGANLIYSLVTRKMRRVVRRQGPLGGAWHTYDVARSTAERDPIRNPFAFEYDAGEHIAAKRNGLHLFALYDARGNRADSVPDIIAKDDSDPRGAGIVVPMLSCVRCHVEDGLRPVANDQRRLLSGEIELFVQRQKDAERLAAFYESNLDKSLARDREDYAEAVLSACDMPPREAAEALAETYSRYVDELVTRGRAARELGLSEDEFTTRLRRSTDPVVLALTANLEVQRQQWEASFAAAAVLAAVGPNIATVKGAEHGK